MKQILLYDFGNTDVLTLANTPTPIPASANEYLVKVAYAGINPIDCKIRNGTSFVATVLKDKLPCSLGFEIAGTIVNRDNNQTILTKQKVCGFSGFPHNPCGYSEYVIINKDDIVSVPDNVPLSVASTLPLAGLTAKQALDQFGKLDKKGLLIHAGAGGVGHLAIQLAKQQGAYVITTASRKKHPFLSALGADECIDYHDQNALTKCQGVDLILDLVGGNTGLQSICLLKKSGLLVTVPTITRDQIITAAKEANKQAVGILMQPNVAQLAELLTLVSADKLHLFIEHTYPIDEVKNAHDYLEKSRTTGKLCLAF